jgi:hypothetical protein
MNIILSLFFLEKTKRLTLNFKEICTISPLKKKKRCIIFPPLLYISHPSSPHHFWMSLWTVMLFWGRLDERTDQSRACGAQERKEGACRLESGGPAPVACGEPSMCVTTERDSLLCSPLLVGPTGLPSHTRPPRPVACRPGILHFLSLSVLSTSRASCPCCMLTAMANHISKLQGRPDRLPVCERSTSPHLHAPFATSVAVDRWQLSAGPSFFITPWHRALYVFMRFRCMFHLMLHMFHLVLHMFHLNVAYVALAIHICCKCIFKCFICFRRMLQVFYLYVSYVAMGVYVCCKYMHYKKSVNLWWKISVMDHQKIVTIQHLWRFQISSWIECHGLTLMTVCPKPSQINWISDGLKPSRLSPRPS